MISSIRAERGSMRNEKETEKPLKEIHSNRFVTIRFEVPETFPERR
jgi:hypothetical protein